MCFNTKCVYSHSYTHYVFHLITLKITKKLYLRIILLTDLYTTTLLHYYYFYNILWRERTGKTSLLKTFWIETLFSFHFFILVIYNNSIRIFIYFNWITGNKPILFQFFFLRYFRIFMCVYLYPYSFSYNHNFIDVRLGCMGIYVVYLYISIHKKKKKRGPKNRTKRKWNEFTL